MIIVVTNRADAHADEVIRRAHSRGLEIFRFNTEDFLSHYSIQLRVDESGRPCGILEDQLGRSVDLANRHVAWLRKPFLDPIALSVDQKYWELIKSEIGATMEVLYQWPTIHWINSPLKAKAARSKLQQLFLAGASGIKVPSTLITNAPATVTDFSRFHEGRLVTKAVYCGNLDVDGLPAAIPTTRVPHADIERFSDRVRLCPTQFQREVSKLFELRVTVVGDEVFAVKIESQSNRLTEVDWRPHVELCEHSAYRLPGDIAEFCVRFLRHFELEFGAFDFIVDDGGDYVFLECNPFGQYLWTEQEAGVQISESILNRLQTYL